MHSNPIDPKLEHQLTKHAQEKYLETLLETANYSELLQAAKTLNELYFLERTKVAWAIREASNNLSELCASRTTKSF